VIPVYARCITSDSSDAFLQRAPGLGVRPVPGDSHCELFRSRRKRATSGSRGEIRRFTGRLLNDVRPPGGDESS
jgi:hypothetical protein